MDMHAKAAKKPDTTARPNDQDNRLMSKRGIHVRSTPIITPNVVTEMAVQATETWRTRDDVNNSSVL